jgi:hypothetical protein
MPCPPCYVARPPAPARIARLHRHADLETAPIIRRARQRRDLALGQLGHEPLQTS